MIERHHAFAGLRLADRNSGPLDEPAERLDRIAVDHAAAGDDERPDRRRQDGGRAIEHRRVRTRTQDVPRPRLEQLGGKVERLRLHVLRQGQRHGSGLGR